MLNGKELIKKGIVCCDFLPENVTQHGIDIRLKKVYKLKHSGLVPAGKEKTILPQYIEVKPYEENGVSVWRLEPGYYMIDFYEGCNIPSDKMGMMVQRSSLARCGGWIHSSIFDAGFRTESMGCFLNVMHPLAIEVGARVAQFYCFDCDSVNAEDLYKGQFQNDCQRKE